MGENRECAIATVGCGDIVCEDLHDGCSYGLVAVQELGCQSRCVVRVVARRAERREYESLLKAFSKLTVPRADRVSLTLEGLAIPPVDHLSNKGTLNVLLDRILSGLPSGLPPDRTMVGLFMNFSRLTDKALREYDAGRAELLLFVSPHVGLQTSFYLRAIDHMENCVGAIHRAVLNARALRANKIGRAGPLLTQRQEQRLSYLRHTIEHSDEKLLGKSKFKNSPPFDKVDPYSLRLANTSMVDRSRPLPCQARFIRTSA